MGFFLTALFYIFLGTFGAFAVCGHDISEANTLFDVFENGYLEFFLRIALLVQLFTILPIVWYISR